MTRPYLKLLALLLLPPVAVPIAHAQDWAKARLDASPRHREWVTLKHDGRSLQAYVVYPEVKQKATVVVLIHEIFGLSDWAREMADEVAAAGYIVVAPDLLSGLGPHGGGSSEFTSQEDSIKAVSALDPSVVTADLDAAADYGKHLPSANGKLAVTGFCWEAESPSSSQPTARTSLPLSSSTARRRPRSPPSPPPSLASTPAMMPASPPRFPAPPPP